MTDRPTMTRKEAADYLRFSIRKIDYLRTKGQLPYSKVGRRVLFLKADLDELLERHRVDAPATTRRIVG